MSGILADLGVGPGRSALLVIDMIRGYMDPELAYHPLEEEDKARLLAGLGALLGAFRAREAPVLYTTNYGRRPTPWGKVDKRNPFVEWQEKTGRPITGAKFPRRSGRLVEGSPYAEIHPPVGPREGEIVVNKRRYDAFYNTDLELVLRGLGTEDLFLCGVNTNNCVLATAYGAFCRDLRVFLVEDACATWNGPEFHAGAVRQVGASLGWVVGSAEVAERFAVRAAAGAS